MCLMDVVQQALLCDTVRVKREYETRCSTCGELKDSNEFYRRVSPTKHAHGTKCNAAGSVVQPCRKCKLDYEANKRKVKRNAKH